MTYIYTCSYCGYTVEGEHPKCCPNCGAPGEGFTSEQIKDNKDRELESKKLEFKKQVWYQAGGLLWIFLSLIGVACSPFGWVFTAISTWGCIYELRHGSKRKVINIVALAINGIVLIECIVLLIAFVVMTINGDLTLS